MNAFTDNDVITFGAHKDKRLEDVPASWLLWAWDEFLYQHEVEIPITDRERLAGYIVETMSALQKDAPDHDVLHKPRFSR